MNARPFGKLGTVSTLSLGGGGLGQLWGPTTREECVATAREAPELGIEWREEGSRLYSTVRRYAAFPSH